VGETINFSISGTGVNSSENWHSPGAMIDLIGGSVRVEGKNEVALWSFVAHVVVEADSWALVPITPHRAF